MKKGIIFFILFCGIISIYAQSVKPFKVDMSKFPTVNSDQTMKYDRKTKIFTSTKFTDDNLLFQYLGMDISQYNLVKIKYKSFTDYGFHVYLDHPDDNEGWWSKLTYCPSYLTEMEFPIKPNQKRLTGIGIVSTNWINNQKFMIEEISFEKVDNPKQTDVFISDEKPVIDAAASGVIDKKISAWDFVKELGVGFQYSVFLVSSPEQDYGMDTYHPWGYTKPSKEQIKFIKDKGFKTLRLQTSPGSHMLDENYTIDPRFIKDLKQVVDWALEEDMYVIICGPLDECMDKEAWVRRFEANDIHYKNYIVEKEHVKESEDFIKSIWKQYATAFNNSYDERLIFETLNEPVDRFHEHNFFERLDCSTCQEDIKILNEYN